MIQIKKRVFVFLMCICTSITIAQEIKFGKVTKEELQEEFYPLDSTANAAVLFKFKKIYYKVDGRKGFTLVTEVHERIKIYNKEGFKYAKKQIRLYGRGGTIEEVNSLKAYTYTLKGDKVVKSKLSKKEIFKEKASNNWAFQKFTMPNLKEKAIVEWRYKTTSPFITFIDDIVLQEFIPVKKTEIKIRIPEYMKFKKLSKGYLPISLVESQKNVTFDYTYRSSVYTSDGDKTARTTASSGSLKTIENVTTVNQINTPALKKEPFVTNVNNYRSTIKFEISSTEFPNSQRRFLSTTWDDVVKTIYKSQNFGVELAKENYFKKDLNAVVAGITDEKQKAIAVFQFLKSKVKWNGNYSLYVNKGVKQAYKNGVGNVAEINLILTAMLRSVDVNANPVLVSTRNNGVPLFPTIKGFNYVVSSAVFKDNSFALFDATERYSLPNMMPIRTINWQGRLIERNGYSREVSLFPKSISVENNNLNVKVTSDGMVEGIMRSKYTNYNAYNFRLKYNAIKESDVQAKIEEDHNIEIENFKIVNKIKIGKPISQLMKFSSEELIEDINNKLYLEPLLFLTNKTNPFKLKERKFPIDFVNPWQDKNVVSIQIPEGYKVESIPTATAISMTSNIGVFKFQASQVGNKIKVMSIVQFNKVIITPEYYKELKEFYSQMLKKQSEKIILVKE